jgi:hypothetical protein
MLFSVCACARASPFVVFVQCAFFPIFRKLFYSLAQRESVKHCVVRIIEERPHNLIGVNLQSAIAVIRIVSDRPRRRWMNPCIILSFAISCSSIHHVHRSARRRVAELWDTLVDRVGSFVAVLVTSKHQIDVMLEEDVLQSRTKVLCIVEAVVVRAQLRCEPTTSASAVERTMTHHDDPRLRIAILICDLEIVHEPLQSQHTHSHARTHANSAYSDLLISDLSAIPFILCADSNQMHSVNVDRPEHRHVAFDLWRRHEEAILVRGEVVHDLMISGNSHRRQLRVNIFDISQVLIPQVLHAISIRYKRISDACTRAAYRYRRRG